MSDDDDTQCWDPGFGGADPDDAIDAEDDDDEHRGRIVLPDALDEQDEGGQ